MRLDDDAMRLGDDDYAALGFDPAAEAAAGPPAVRVPVAELLAEFDAPPAEALPRPAAVGLGRGPCGGKR